MIKILIKMLRFALLTTEKLGVYNQIGRYLNMGIETYSVGGPRLNEKGHVVYPHGNNGCFYLIPRPPQPIPKENPQSPAIRKRLGKIFCR